MTLHDAVSLKFRRQSFVSGAERGPGPVRMDFGANFVGSRSHDSSQPRLHMPEDVAVEEPRAWEKKSKLSRIKKLFSHTRVIGSEPVSEGLVPNGVEIYVQRAIPQSSPCRTDASHISDDRVDCVDHLGAVGFDHPEIVLQEGA